MVKTVFRKNRPAWNKNCARLLLIVIVKQRDIKNCFLGNLIVVLGYEGKFIRGIWALSPIWFLVTAVALITLFWAFEQLRSFGLIFKKIIF